MLVTVFLPQMLRVNAAGAARLEVELDGDPTLGGLLDEIGDRHPALERRLRDETGALRRYINFYLDGQECRSLDGSATVLVEGTEVRVIPSVAGG